VLNPAPSNSWFDAGVRIPLASDNSSASSAQFAGVLGDFDRAEAYVPKLVSVGLMFTGQTRTSEGIVTRGSFGFSVLQPTGSASGTTNAYLNYGGYLGLKVPLLQMLAGVTGRFVLTGSATDLSDRVVNQLSISASLMRGTWHPTVYVRLPLSSNLSNALNYTLGFGLTFAPR